MSMQPRLTPPAYALLIGISDYSVYSKSVQGDNGVHDMPAGKNDALSFYRIARELGILPGNIRILTSPMPSPGELAGSLPGYIGLATRDEIVKQLAWLSQMLTCEAASKNPPLGLLAYSGHGDFAGDDFALCPSDVRAKEGALATEDLENVLPFYMVDGIFRSRRGAAEHLTVLVDASFASTQDAWGPGRRSSLTGRRARSAERAVQPIGDCTLIAARPGEVARAGELSGRAQGIFTWATSIVADSWRIAAIGKRRNELTISRGDLVDRLQMLLGALSLPQTPMLLGPRDKRDHGFFRPGSGNRTAPAPKPQAQLDPDYSHTADFTLYTFELAYSGGTKYGHVLSVDADGLGYTGGREYWDLQAGFVSAWSTATGLNISASEGSWSGGSPSGWGGSTSSWATPSNVSWTTGSPPSGSLYAAGDGTFNAFAVKIGGSDSSPSPSWYINHTSTPAQGTYVVPAATSFSTTSRGDYTWYVG